MMEFKIGDSALEPMRTEMGPVIRLTRTVKGKEEVLEIPVGEFESLVVAYNAVRNFTLAQTPRA